MERKTIMECVVRNLSLYYEDVGEGTPVLLLHGYHVDHRIMSGCMEPLFEGLTGYRRIYVDLPGMGRTKPGWVQCADDMLELLLTFIDRVLPGERFLLAGESYGGYLARGIVRRLGGRVAGLMLLCPAILTDFKKRTLPAHTVIAKDDALLASLSPEDLEAFTEINVVQTEEVFRRFRDEIQCGIQLADMPFLKAFQENAYGFSFDVDAPGAPYLNPALFLMGRQDGGVGYQDAWAILESYPRAAFAVLDRAGHNLQIEQPVLFDVLVKEWLERVKEAAG
jgi:pimeloyl-ACP methyl ester carboxylesterase